MLISGLFDALDGAIARIYGEATKFGGFFDSVLDRYADAVVLSGIIVGGLTNLIWGLAALFGSLLVSYARARAEAAGVKMESVGLAERAGPGRQRPGRRRGLLRRGHSHAGGQSHRTPVDQVRKEGGGRCGVHPDAGHIRPGQLQEIYGLRPEVRCEDPGRDHPAHIP